MDNTDLDTNPNQGGGKRIFPDKQSHGDENPDRQKVRVVATYIGPVLENQRVYFKSFDVDDPSTSTVIDPLGNVGNDNLPPGAGTLSQIEKVTDGDGKAKITLTVGMSPGDNYRVAASLDNTKLQEPYLTQAMADADTPPSGVTFSPMLTVWRKLWVERDYMARVAPTGSERNNVVGTATSFSYDPAQHVTVIGLGQNLPDAFDDENQFRHGRYVAGGKTYQIAWSTANTWGADTVTVDDPNGDARLCLKTRCHRSGRQPDAVSRANAADRVRQSGPLAEFSDRA